MWRGRPKPVFLPAGRSLFSADRELSKLACAQRRLLAQSAPQIQGYEVVLAYRPAYMATGDYHDFFRRRDGRVASFVGDGSGHGPSACVLMATMRTILLTHPQLHKDPGTTLTMAGRIFNALIPSDLFMTGLYLLFGDEGRVSWASAGQDPPLWIRRGRQLAPIDLGIVGLPLGIDPSQVYPTMHWKLEAGERLLLFTDGLVEACNRHGEAFGRCRLRSLAVELACLCLEEMVAQLLARVAAHMEGTEFRDDVTILAVERQAPDGTGERRTPGQWA